MSTEGIGPVEAMNCLYTDLLMLHEGEWEPCEHSVEASIGMLEIVAEILDIDLQDNREES